MVLFYNMTVSQSAPPSISSSIDTNRILVIIPALDEEATIGPVVTCLREMGLNRIRVVDNGSTDSTANRAKAAGADVLVEAKQGYGQACWRGLQKLTDGIEWILFCDADGSDDLDDLPRLLKAASGTDLVLGNRRASHQGRSSLTPLQNCGNALATFLIRLGWGYRYHDLGPLRLIRRHALERMELADRGFGWTIEMQLRAVEMGLKIREVPVTYRPRQAGKSKISGSLKGSIVAGAAILSTLTKLFIQKTLVQRSLLFLSVLFLILGSGFTIPYGNFHIAENIPRFLVGISLMAFGFVLSWGIRKVPISAFWIVTIGTRALLWFMTPGGDIWRYIWEGKIRLHGFNPYLLAPNDPSLQYLRDTVWDKVGHYGITAIYPPLAQTLFMVLAWIHPSASFFKLFFILIDLLICALLTKRFPLARTILYAWNPLIIYSFAGGGHYDSCFILMIVAGWFFYESSSSSWTPILAAICLGCSVALKWISLPIVVWFLYQEFKKRSLGQTFFLLLLTVLPFVGCWILFYRSASLADFFPKDFVLYARSAELFPYFLAHIWPASEWKNWLHLIPLALICLWLFYKYSDFSLLSENYFAWLLIFSPAVHAWYFTWLIPFSVATSNLGTRLVSLSSFTYFWLEHTKATQNGIWQQSAFEKTIMWLPFILGLIYSVKFSSHPSCKIFQHSS